MENYVSKSFLSSIDRLLNLSANDILIGTATDKTALFKLLMALPLNIDSSELELGPLACNSFKEIIIKNSIKKNQLNIKRLENLNENIENWSAFYFIDQKDAEEISLKNGVVCKGADFDCQSFYTHCTITDLQIKDTWDSIKDHIPPVNAMLIIDQYIFSSPFEKKLFSLCNFIKLFKKDLFIPFHLSILFSPVNSIPLQIDKAFKTIFDLGNIEIRLYADWKIPRSDRLIFTNYTSGNIGHPFDNRDTRFSQNFLGNENSEEKIIKNYRDYKKDLLFWNSYLKKIPKQMCNAKSIWESSGFQNRLFEPL